MSGHEIVGPACAMDEFAIAEPAAVDTAGMGPDMSKKEIDFGSSGVEKSNSSMPAGLPPTSDT